MIIDGRRGRGDVPTDFDVCVVGSGPAGMTVATALAARGLRVGVIEGGGTHVSLRGQRMLLDTPSGAPYWNLAAVRTRMLGGSGNRWGGISRPIDPLDLERREWVPDSGWPIGWTDLAAYLERAAAVLDLPEVPTDGTLESELFETAHYRTSPRTRLGAELAVAPGQPVVLTELTVTGLQLRNDSNRIEYLQARAFGGRRHRITASRFVLAAGGIENARLLLVSRGRAGRALGNDHDVVGRYFMEHLHAPIAEFVPAGQLLGWDSYDLGDWPRLRRSLVPKADVQRARGLLNASLAIGPRWYVGYPPFADRDYRVGLLYERVISALAAHHIPARLPGPLRSLRRRAVDRPERLVVYRGEQPPHRENRVVLGGGVDAFGSPRAHLQWTIGDREIANAPAVLAMFRDSAAAHGWGTVGAEFPDWVEHIIGGPHHMGTTRMSADPHAGVVDGDCKVHSVDNLYVAGSSVFATGGHANPTMTLVALALRLADHLAAQKG